jgi:hypothetical protein
LVLLLFLSQVMSAYAVKTIEMNTFENQSTPGEVHLQLDVTFNLTGCSSTALRVRSYNWRAPAAMPNYLPEGVALRAG